MVLKKLIAALVALGAIFSLQTFVFAQNAAGTTPTPKPRQEIGQDIKERRQELNQDFKQKRDELKEQEASRRAELKEKRLELVNKRFTYISRHLNAYLARLNKIADKIAARIAKLEARGVDTSKAQLKLDESVALKDAAKIAIDKAIIDAQSVTGSDDVKAATEKAVASIKEAKNALMAYHKKLVEAIRELKSSRELREGTGSAELD